MIDLPFAPPPEPTAEFEAFRTRAYKLTGIDLSAYRAPQMYRRLVALLAQRRLISFNVYAALLERDQEARDEFCQFVTINVSEFFRNTPRYAELENLVLPRLLKETRDLKVWSAGCSLGAEPYSLAILLLELAPERAHQILATDIDRQILARARAAADYTDLDLGSISRERRLRWFTPTTPGTYALAPRARGLVSFSLHDLIRDPYPNGPFDLIACRNVVIYFTDEIKTQIYTRFASVLRPGGVLFVGGTESIMRYRALGLQPAGPGLYLRPPA